MSAASIAGSIRPFQSLMSDRASRPLWISRAIELLADWSLLVALLAIVYRASGSVPALGLFVLARVLPRSIAGIWLEGRVSSIDARALGLLGIARAPLVAALALVSVRGDLWWAAIVVVAIAALAALSDAGRSAWLSRALPRARLGAANALNLSIERFCFLFGPLIGALVIARWGAEEAFIVAAVLLAVSGAIGLLQPHPPLVAPNVPSRADLPSFRQRPLLVMMAAALFISAAVATSLIASLIVLATGPLERSEATLGALLACVGLGMFVGPLPVSKLMGRLPIPFLLAGSAASLAGGMAVISQLSWLPVVALILFLIGLCATTNDIIATTALRRSTRDAHLPGAVRAMRIATLSGQIAGAAMLAVLGDVWSVTSVLLAAGAIGVVAAGLLFVFLYGRYYLNRFSGRGRAAT